MNATSALFAAPFVAPFVVPPGFNIKTDSPYHYWPTQSVSLFFTVLLGLSTITHAVELIWKRTWWLIPTAVLAGFGEFVGWGARFLSSSNPVQNNPFSAQIVSLIISPTPLLAANFIILGRLIGRIGPEYSRLSPLRYTKVFLTADIVALFIVGGVWASGDSETAAKDGGFVMLGGIAFQFLAMLAYIGLGAEFFVRYMRNKPLKSAAAREHIDLKARRTAGDSVSLELGKPTSEQSISSWRPSQANASMRGRFDRIPHKLRLQILGLCLSTTFLLIRAIYRTAELADGWNGVIISTQIYFILFDGLMVLFAMITLNVLHPGFLLRVD